MILTAADLARIDAYRGAGEDLHALLPSVLPLAGPRQWVAEVTAQHGTRMRLGYYATPHRDGILVSWTCAAQGSDRVIVSTPTAITPRGMDRPAGITDDEWRETRAAAGIIIRALLLGIGDAP